MPADHRISVPGRLCLIGEHSDWAANYRLHNSNIPPGAALIVCLRQCLTASAKAHDHRLILRSTLGGQLDVPIENALHHARTSSCVWRYGAAVAYTMNTRFRHAHGIDVAITSETLPPAKGFSSSAALCVLIARAFNVVYDLSLTPRAEMDIAFAAERLTGSACGRMDQIVAVGIGKVARMEFDVDFIDYSLVPVPKPSTSSVYIVVADLNFSKNTAVILKSMQAAYPCINTKEALGLREYLGHRNKHYVNAMQRALEDEDGKTLGVLMTQAQKEFDLAAIPLCPEQLTAPRLHAILSDDEVLPLVYGGKGVGSQGDGAAQFIARGPKEAKKLVQVLERKLGAKAMIVTPFGSEDDNTSLDLVNFEGRLITRRDTTNNRKGFMRAVIPTAGYGTRLYPASRSIRPKSLMPIVDQDGFTKPILLHLVEQAIRGGVDEVTIVSTPGGPLQAVQHMFTDVEEDLAEKLKPRMRKYAETITSLSAHLRFALQTNALGFGHAVACGIDETWDGETGVVVLLGDVVFSAGDTVRSVITAHEKCGGKSIVGTARMVVDKAVNYGVVRTAPRKPGDLNEKEIGLDVIEMMEKPSEEQAIELATDGFCDVVLGPYVLSRAAVHALKRCVTENIREGGEIQLTTALIAAIHAEGIRAFRIPGDALDTGNSVDYALSVSTLAP